MRPCGQTHAAVVGKLSPVAVNTLVKLIAELKVGPLAGENGPRCTDAPTTSFQINKGGQQVVISRTSSCVKEDMVGASELVQLMHAAHSLAKLVD